MTEHDLVVIGAGPGGYVAAIRAAQLGMNVGCVEMEDMLGGTCLRIGCIPSKALLESSALYLEAKVKLAAHGVRVGDVGYDLEKIHERKQQIVRGLGNGVGELFKKHKIARYAGQGRLLGPGKVRVDGAAGPTELQSRRILIATGSRAGTLPGIALDGERIGTSTEALAYSAVPKELIVIGAGAIGLELGSVWHRLGAKVTLLEYLDRILPDIDGEVAAAALRIFQKQGLEFQLGVRVTGSRVADGRCIVECAGRGPLTADRVLLAVGRLPNTEGLGLETANVQADPRGRIVVNEHFETTAAGIFAIGDVIAGPMLAHKAEEEGIACVEYLATGYGHVNYNAIPGVVYTAPEVAGVGRTEEQLVKSGIAIKKGTFPFRANSRARIFGDTDGLVKMLADARTDRILGVHIVGPRAGDLIAEAAVAIEFGASTEDLARCSHAHPSLSETLKEAALAVDRRALHG